MTSQTIRQVGTNNSDIFPGEISERFHLAHTFTGMIERRHTLTGIYISSEGFKRVMVKIFSIPYKDLRSIIDRIDETDNEKKRQIVLQHMFPEHNL
jgi:hypothetical protein